MMEGFSLCGQMVLDWLDETAEGMTAYGGVPIFDVIYSQVAHDIRQHVADLLDGRRVELTVSLMEVRAGTLRNRLAAIFPIPSDTALRVRPAMRWKRVSRPRWT